MSWDYATTLGPLALADVADAAVLEGEGGSSFLDPGIRISHIDGIALDPQASYGPLTLTLRTPIRYTDAAGAVTHPDGPAGHFYDNLSKIKAELAGPGLAALGRTAPQLGDVRAMCKLLTPPIFGGARERHVYRWVLTAPSGSWQDAAESSATIAGGVTTSGDRRVFDPTIEFGAAGTVTHTATDGTESEVTAETGPSYPVTVYWDEASGKWRAVDDTGADARGFVSWTKPWVLRMEPDLAQTFTGAATIRWRNRWA